MSFLTLVYIYVVTFIFVVEGQSSCKTPSGENGVCKSIYACPSLLRLISSNVTSEDKDLLQKSRCGTENVVPEVCCTDPCYTPDGQPGQCVNINSCDHLYKMLTPPASKENIAYVHSSKCLGKDQDIVCCGPPKDSSPSRFSNCKNEVTAFPPNPSTDCCGVHLSSDKILGGNYTQIDSYPWSLLIEYVKLEKTKLICGGTLISSRYALTSGHCVVGPVLNFGTPTNVRLGEYDTKQDGPDCVPAMAGGDDCTEGTVSIPIEHIIPHPDYNPNNAKNWNDVALIRLKNAAPFTDFIRPICLPTVDIALEPSNNLRLVTVGWSSSKSNVKNHRVLPFVKMEDCQKSYASLLHSDTDLWKGQVCAGGEGRGVCIGDGGGPLMYENNRHYEITGVVSFGPKKCSVKGVPTIYTNVYEYNTWIRSNIRP